MDYGIKAQVLEEIKKLALKYDIVNLNGSVQRELLESIEKEGVL